MKQKFLFIGGSFLFLLTTLIVVLIPIEIGNLNGDQLFFLLFIATIGYFTSLMYFYNWIINEKFKQ